MRMLRLSAFTLFFFLAVASYASIVAAQSLPSTAEPGRTQTDLRRGQAAPEIPAPRDMVTTPDVQAPAGAEKVTFVLKDVQFVGAESISPDELAPMYQAWVGQTITLAQVYELANKVTALYRDRGYLLSRAIVPEQKINDGLVKIQIVEGFVDGYTIQGNAGGQESFMTAYAEEMVKSKPLTVEKLERYLLLMNDLPGLQVRAVLAPSATAMGGADMILIAEHDVFEGFGQIDNYGNIFLGETRVQLAGQVNALFGASDQWNAAVLSAPDSNELWYGAFGVSRALGHEGTRIGLNANYVDSNPSLKDSTLVALDTEGRSLSASLSLNHPLVRSRRLNVNGALSFDLTHNETDYAPGFASIETEDTQRIARLGLDVNYLDNLAGYNTATGVLSRGFEIMGASEKGDSNLSRSNGDPSFTKFELELSRLQRIYGGVTGLLAVSGQYSADPLLASEEFAFGGTEYGRGFDSSEITGDHGVAAKVELAWANEVQSQFLEQYQLYGFYDIGKTWNKDLAAGTDSVASGASTGLGVRLNMVYGVEADMFLAKPLTRDVPSRSENADEWRFKFSLRSNF